MRGGAFEQDLGDMDADATAAAITRHRPEIVGIKVAHYAGPGWEPVDRAVAAARATGTRVMVDFGGHVPELSLEDLLLHRLGPGDIFTHAYADVKGRTAVVDDRGLLRPFVRAARARQILFDVGYGGRASSSRRRLRRSRRASPGHREHGHPSIEPPGLDARSPGRALQARRPGPRRARPREAEHGRAGGRHRAARSRAPRGGRGRRPRRAGGGAGALHLRRRGGGEGRGLRCASRAR